MNCTRPTKSGRPCTKPHKARGSCSLHMDAADRAWYDGRTRGIAAARLLTYDPYPACWTWELAPVAAGLDEDAQWYAMRDWQGGRCAICGGGDPIYAPSMVEDHDHETGLTRGFLCHGCNVHEGFCGKRWHRCARYRERPPVAILGLRIEYAGRESSWADFYRRSSALPEL